jgi:hypothetical protein
MKWEDIKNLSPGAFKRATGVKRAVFDMMLETVSTYKKDNRIHASRGRPAKLTLADKLLLMLMYYREYRTQFHIGMSYGIAESTVCEIIKDLEQILIKDKRFHLPGKKELYQSDNQIKVIVVDVTESPIERPKKNSGAITRVNVNDTPKRHKS